MCTKFHGRGLNCKISDNVSLAKFVSIWYFVLALFQQSDLTDLERDLDSSVVYYVRQSLCTTLGGNDCPLVTISSPPSVSTRPPAESQECGEEGSGMCYMDSELQCESMGKLDITPIARRTRSRTKA